jgi:hypothetical protein
MCRTTIIERADGKECEMIDRFAIPPDATHEQIEMVVGALYLISAYTFRHILNDEGKRSAGVFKEELVAAVKRGDISMSLLDDAATFDFVTSMVDSLGGDSSRADSLVFER